MFPDNYFSYMTSAMIALFSQSGGFFAAIGAALFHNIAAFLLFLFGAEVLFSRSVDTGKLVRIVFMILVCATILRYYSKPSPFGGSFSHLITDEASSLSNSLEGGQNEALQARLNQAYWKVEKPGWLSASADFAPLMYYCLVVLLIAAMRVVLIAVVAAGFVGVGLCVLTGPLFLPWMLFPGLEFIFWGWFKAFLQYAFYQVVASAVVFITAKFVIAFMDAHPSELTIYQLPTLGVQFAGVLAIAILVLVKVPSYASSIFSGRAGESLFRG